jgi:hypothetical protein
MRLTLIELSELEKNITKRIDKKITENKSLLPPIIYLEGGHYDPRYEISDFSIKSLENVLNVANNLIFKHKANIKIVIGILVDNLGLQCSENSCDISNIDESNKNEEDLPIEIEEVLSKYIIVKKERMIISNERNCKNKAISFLKKITEIKQNRISVDNQNDVLSVNYQTLDNQIIQIAEIKSNITWVAKCPSIMAQHYTNVTNKILKRFPNSESITIIDFSEIEDINKVTRGVELALDIFFPSSIKEKQIEILNIFKSDFGDDEYTIVAKNTELTSILD